MEVQRYYDTQDYNTHSWKQDCKSRIKWLLLLPVEKKPLVPGMVITVSWRTTQAGTCERWGLYHLPFIWRGESVSGSAWDSHLKPLFAVLTHCSAWAALWLAIVLHGTVVKKSCQSRHCSITALMQVIWHWEHLARLCEAGCVSEHGFQTGPLSGAEGSEFGSVFAPQSILICCQ